MRGVLGVIGVGGYIPLPGSVLTRTSARGVCGGSSPTGVCGGSSSIGSAFTTAILADPGCCVQNRRSVQGHVETHWRHGDRISTRVMVWEMDVTGSSVLLPLSLPSSSGALVCQVLHPLLPPPPSTNTPRAGREAQRFRSIRGDGGDSERNVKLSGERGRHQRREVGCGRAADPENQGPLFERFERGS